DRHRRLDDPRQAHVARIRGGEARARRAVALLRDATRLDGRGARRGRLRGVARELAAVAKPVTPPSERRPATLADLAREAGTSRSTASRALSGQGYVSPDARRRLMDAAERLGYVPNASARTLKQRRSRVVGVIVSDLGNQFYARLAAGVEQVLREHGYQMVLVGDNNDADEELTAARTFLAMHAPGVILTPGDAGATGFLHRRGVPVVEVDRRMSTGDAVVIDNVRGGRDAVEHLI